MDVTTILATTINNLSQPHVINSQNNGELQIAGAEITSEGREASREEINQIVHTLNKAASSVDKRVSFAFHEKTRRVVMRITDPVTKEVVRQIPSKDMVRILENIHDFVGMFIDEQR
jgi:flagellar protein FlaG